MKVILNVVLTQAARSKGGDRYECPFNGRILVLYVPQEISREGLGFARQNLTITFEGE